MIKKHLKKRIKVKKQLKRIYELGYNKAIKIKNEEIRTLKNKFNNLLKIRDCNLAEIEKRIQKIEESLNSHYDLICQTNHLIKKIKNKSYVQFMDITEEHSKIESLNDGIEMLEIKIAKSRKRINNKLSNIKQLIDN